jgi:spoIIIJ-associated protein
MKKKDKIKLIEDMASGLLKLMGTNVEVEVQEDKKNDAVVVNIQTEDEAGLIIGNRGRTLNAIQTMLGMMYRQETNEWQRILVNVADWREKEEGRLERLAKQSAERAKSTGQAQFLYNLSPSQRRIIHLVLADDKEVGTESLGEGKDRYLVIHPSK